MAQSRKNSLFLCHTVLPFSRWKMSHFVQKSQPNGDLHDYTEFVSLKLQCPDYQVSFPSFAFLAENTYVTCIIKSLKNPVLNSWWRLISLRQAQCKNILYPVTRLLKVQKAKVGTDNKTSKRFQGERTDKGKNSLSTSQSQTCTV